MKISPLNTDQCNAALARIVSDFGNSHLEEGRYIFDAITRLPPGFVEKRQTAKELTLRLRCYPNVLVVFDPNPRNTPYRLNLLHALGIDADVVGVEIGTEDLPILLANNDCDFYVLAPDSGLLSVATHEDEILNNERVLWCPVRITNIE